MDNKNRTVSYDAPKGDRLTIEGVKQWLVDHGCCAVISTNNLAALIGKHRHLVKEAERSGELESCDKCTYTLDAAAKWLVHHPRYISEVSEATWIPNDETHDLIRAIISKSYQGLLRIWNNDLEDLTAEVSFRMMKTKKTGDVPESVIIMRRLCDLWREAKNRNRHRNVSLDAIQEKGMQV